MPQKIKKEFLFLALIGFFIFVSFLIAELDAIVYWAFVNIFHIAHARFLLGIILGFFSGGFLLMLLVERYYTNLIIRFLYLLTAIWMGIFVYFFSASLIYLIFGLFINMPIFIGIILLFTAVAVSVYGFIHGRKIVVKNIKVALPNTPEVWKKRKIVFISDVHLGPIMGAKFAEKITKIINSLSLDIIFIGGDLFDGSFRPDPFVIAKPLGNLSAPLGTFFVAGNHEEYRDPIIFFEAIEKIGIKILDNKMVEIDGLQIIGVDYQKASNKKHFKEILENLKIDKNKPSILLKHEPKDLKIAEEAGISFQISGHTHDGQQWPFNYLTKIMYKGFSYGLKHYRSMAVFVSSGVGGWGPPLRVGSDYEIVCIEFI